MLYYDNIFFKLCSLDKFVYEKGGGNDNLHIHKNVKSLWA